MKHFQFCFFTSLTSCHKFSHPSFCITISLECKISTLFSFTMPPKRKPSQNLQRVRKHRAIEGGLKSHSVTFPQNVRRKFARIMRDGCKHILANDFVDQLKSPRGQPIPDSAKLAASSFNVYYGGDVLDSEQTIGGVETVERFAYATATGAGSIGLDPQTFTIKPLPPYFEELKAAVEDRPEEVLPAKYKGNFNAMSVKIYYKGPKGRNKTGWHCDVSYNKKDNVAPAFRNSQVPEKRSSSFAKLLRMPKLGEFLLQRSNSTRTKTALYAWTLMMKCGMSLKESGCTSLSTQTMMME